MSNQEFEDVIDLIWLKPQDEETGLAAGDVIDAVYVEKMTTRGQFGENASFKFLTAEGNLYGIGGSVMKRKMAMVEEGSYVRITYEGYTEKEIDEEQPDGSLEKKLVKIDQWSVQRAKPPYQPEIEALMEEAKKYKTNGANAAAGQKTSADQQFAGKALPKFGQR